MEDYTEFNIPNYIFEPDRNEKNLIDYLFETALKSIEKNSYNLNNIINTLDSNFDLNIKKMTVRENNLDELNI